MLGFLSIKPIVGFSSLISSFGILSGNIFFGEILGFATVDERLKEKRESILDTKGNQDDAAWLVLAQKYREQGTTKKGEKRNFENQINPGFLSENFWNSYIKEKEDFSNDEIISRELKKVCANSYYKVYKENLFSNIKKWCQFNLSDLSKLILKFQKDNGDCRFWLVESSASSTGWFIWEILEYEKLSTWHNLLLELYIGLNRGFLEGSKQTSGDNLVTRGKNILDKCKEKKGKILELSYISDNKSSNKSWKVSDQWNSNTNKEHKIPNK